MIKAGRKFFFPVAMALILAVSFLIGFLPGLTPAEAAAVPTVVYDGGTKLIYTDETGSQISGNGDFGTAFDDMLPGVTYTQDINLLNSSSQDTVYFYMDLEVLKTLQADGLTGAGYTVSLKSGGTELYTSKNGTVKGALIGGSGSSGELEDLNQDLVSGDRQGFMVAAVGPGSRTTLSLSIQADGSMDNAYQNADGTISFRFFGEVVDGPVAEVVNRTETQKEADRIVTRTTYSKGTPVRVKKTVYVAGNVQTGDRTPIIPAVGAAAGAGILLTVLVILKRRRKKAS